MSEINDKSLTVIELFQKQMSTRNPLEFGTQFSIEGQNKTITLRNCSNKEYMTFSPFTEFIEKNISRKHFQMVKEVGILRHYKMNKFKLGGFYEKS